MVFYLAHCSFECIVISGGGPVALSRGSRWVPALVPRSHLKQLEPPLAPHHLC